MLERLVPHVTGKPDFDSRRHRAGEIIVDRRDQQRQNIEDDIPGKRIERTLRHIVIQRISAEKR